MGFKISSIIAVGQVIDTIISVIVIILLVVYVFT